MQLKQLSVGVAIAAGALVALGGCGSPGPQGVGTIAGYVRVIGGPLGMPQGRPDRHGVVTARRDDGGPVVTTKTDARGVYVLRLSHGIWTVNAGSTVPLHVAIKSGQENSADLVTEAGR
jgi:hypothetical protein